MTAVDQTPTVVTAVAEALEVRRQAPLPTSAEAAVRDLVAAIDAFAAAFDGHAKVLEFPSSAGQLIDETDELLDMIREAGELVGYAVTSNMTCRRAQAFGVGRSLVELLTNVADLRFGRIGDKVWRRDD